MNPFGPMFSGLIDNAVMLAITIAIVSAGAVCLPRSRVRGQTAPISELYFLAFAKSLLLLHALIAILQLVGISGMFLGVVTPLWFFWEMLYLVSVGIVFHQTPILILVALVWIALGRWRLQFSLRPLVVTVLLIVAFGVNVGLHFAFEACTQHG